MKSNFSIIPTRQELLEDLQFTYEDYIKPILVKHNLPTNMEQESNVLRKYAGFQRMSIFYFKTKRLIEQEIKIGREVQSKEETYWRLYKNFANARRTYERWLDECSR